ncbi:MAG: hypothetical protein H7321_07500 [Bacteroidia bacterium]|nr:hypothetical protein [Bacteroidia bacterium]
MTKYILIFLLSVTSILKADMGPKPSMNFKIDYDTSVYGTLIEGYQLQSESSDFKTFDTLKTAGPQHFMAIGTVILSRAYDYSPYNKIVLKFEKGWYSSNVFTKGSFNANYNITFENSKLKVSETLTSAYFIWIRFVISLIITLIIEYLIASFVLRKLSFRNQVLKSVLVINCITLPILWLATCNISGEYFLITLIAGEILVFVTEAIYYEYRHKENMNVKSCYGLSFYCNLSSFLIGSLVTAFLYFL